MHDIELLLRYLQYQAIPKCIEGNQGALGTLRMTTHKLRKLFVKKKDRVKSPEIRLLLRSLWGAIV